MTSIVNIDTSHQHHHIIANRIGFDRQAVSDSNNYKKMSGWCREMERKYNLENLCEKTYTEELKNGIPAPETIKRPKMPTSSPTCSKFCWWQCF